MCVQGVSIRKVAAITDQLCGVQLNSMQVSRAAQQLDEQLTKWRERRLGKKRYLYLDARYEKVRSDGQVRDAAVLLAMGVLDDGTRALLGVSVAVSEQEVHWRQFLQSLVGRGLSGVELVIKVFAQVANGVIRNRGAVAAFQRRAGFKVHCATHTEARRARVETIV